MTLTEDKDEKQSMDLADARCFQSSKLQQFQSVYATIKSFIYDVKLKRNTDCGAIFHLIIAQKFSIIYVISNIINRLHTTSGVFIRG